MIRWIPLVVALGACNGKTAFECSEELPCSGLGEVCTDGQCVDARCANSSQCPMESHCDNGDCLPGCVEESDCYPGSTCDVELKTCEPEACVDSQIDCGYREFCNAATGDCYDAGTQFCNYCDYQPNECGENNICYANYCGVDCSQGQECPGGFECSPFVDDVGNIVTYQCFTYCWLYEDLEPGDFVKGGLRPLGPLPYPESQQPTNKER